MSAKSLSHLVSQSGEAPRAGVILVPAFPLTVSEQLPKSGGRRLNTLTAVR